MSQPPTPPLRVAVVGAGPAGLVTLKHLVTAHHHFGTLAPIEARLFEATGHVGGVFSSKMYEDAEMVSSRYLTCFSDFRLPDSAPDFLPALEYEKYLGAYATHFGLDQHIVFNTRVVKLHHKRCHGASGHDASNQRNPSDRAAPYAYTIHFENTHTHSPGSWACDAVAICSGLNDEPFIPHVQGLEHVPATHHAAEIKDRAALPAGGTVVVMGAGETGLDMAWLAVTSDAVGRVVLCHRDGFFCGPKIVPAPTVLGVRSMSGSGKPVDCSTASLFDTAYVPPSLQGGPLLWWYYDLWIRWMHWLISGTEEGPDQWVGQMDRRRKHVQCNFLVKSTHALPYLSAGHRSKSLLQRVRALLINVPVNDESLRSRRIETAPWPARVLRGGVLEFDESTLTADEHAAVMKTPVKADMVIFATGYQPRFARAWGLDEATHRGVHAHDNVGVGFIGFVRPSIGAIPPLAELQAQLWILNLLKHTRPSVVPPRHRRAIKPYELDYMLHPTHFPSTSGTATTASSRDFARTKRGIDHESYAYQLALDIGSAPTAAHVLAEHGWRVWLVWAMGPSFTTKFRMVGPWRMSKQEVEAIMEGELWGVVRRTGGAVFFLTYTLVPMILFGTLSMVMWAVGVVAGLFERLGGWIAPPSRAREDADAS